CSGCARCGTGARGAFSRTACAATSTRRSSAARSCPGSTSTSWSSSSTARPPTTPSATFAPPSASDTADVGHGEASRRAQPSGRSARALRAWHRKPTEALAELVAEADQLALGERREHLRQRRGRKLAEQPGEDAGIDAAILLEGERKVSFGREAGALEEQKVDQVARLRPRKQTGELGRPQVGQRLDHDAVDRRRRWF